MRRISKAGFLFIYCCISMLCQTSMAQNYPTLPSDPAVVRGGLPNGITYYITPNSSAKGLADIALVQKTGGKDAGLRARRNLDSLPLFRDRRPADFLLDHGIRPAKDGFIQVNENSTVYRFRNLPLTGPSTAIDSVLLLTFNIIKADANTDNKKYSPENQAIIISGNIDAGAIIPKLQLFSMMIPHDPAPEAAAKVLPEIKDSAFLTEQSMPDGITSLKLTFRTGHMPEKYINTVLPLMSKHLWNLSSKIIRDRLEKEFKLSGIPVGRILFSSRGEGKYSGDTEYFISLVVNTSDSEAAKKTVMAILNDMAEGGMFLEELRSAERKIVIDMKRAEAATFRSNEIMVDKCISSFIYGTSIVNSKDEAAYLLSSDVRDDVWLDILTGFIKGLISPLQDRTTDYALQGKPYSADVRDTVLFPGVQNKVKLSKIRPFKVSDGPVWTFSNGINVYYKNFATNGDIYYDMTLRYGYGEIGAVKDGEGAFFSDLFFTGNICGISGHNFRSILEDNGISMQVNVNLNNTRIHGRIKREKLEFFMKAMLAVFGGYETDPEAARYYIDCERIRLTERQGSFGDRMAAVDSIMCTGYDYSMVKNIHGLHNELPELADEFFKELFTKTDDGGLILIGNIEDYKLKRILQQHLGGFRTSNIPRMNPLIQFQPSSGWSTYTTEGKETTVDVVTSIPLPLNGQNYMAAKITADFVYDALADELSGYSLHYFTRTDFSFAPQERFNLVITVEKADADGLPLSIKEGNFLQVIYAIRHAISSLETKEIVPEKLAAYKNKLKSGYDSETGKPEYWLSVISDRIAYGKTFNRFYGEAIDAVTADDIKKIIKDMNQGTRVEYIVKKAQAQ